MRNERIIVQPDDPRGEAATKLMSALLAEEAERYSDLGPDTFDSFRPEDVLAPRSAFVIARLDAQPAGCGALREIDAGSAEINRIYVTPSMRRRGIGRAILAELERRAVEFRHRVIRLVTGNRQPEAVSLYESSGFHRIPAFGARAADPVSLFFEKELVSVENQVARP
jgi:GNAT superfamily N-acetyltransferase